MSWLKKLLGLSESIPAGSSGSGPASGSLAGERVLVADPGMTIQKLIELTLRMIGADGVLTKPFEPGALIAQLRDLRQKRPRVA